MTAPHSTGNYVPSGRGIMYIAPWSGDTPPTYPGTAPSQYPTAKDIIEELGDFVDVGNAPSFDIEPVTENRPHISSRSGLNFKDFNPITTLEYNLNFSLDEIAAVNLNMFLLGELDATSGIIAGLSGAGKEYAVVFIGNNPIGPNANSYFRKVTIKPNGPFQLIGDEYLTMTYLGEGLADSANHAASPYFDYKFVTTTTTSTTTTTTV
ncbi:MAG: hypothetical protein PF503_06245 [Desulfobacula sp.]|jgi:hypothetical protein|nr:hypothetical protein [Desulfobacula sp.]